jgi:phosphonatase-like hydrolase
MTPKLAVLDMAGTTVNDNGLVQQAAINSMKEIANTQISLSDANRVMGIPKQVAFEQLCSIHGKNAEPQQIEALLYHFNNELEHLYSIPGNLTLMPFVKELFDLMKARGTKIYLNTGFNKNLADIIVKELKLNQIIDGYIASDEVKKGRPHPDMIQLAMKREKIEYAHKVMKVGDTISDLFEGYSAGCAWNIAVLTGAQTYDDLYTAPYTQILNNLEPLLRIFEKKKK